MSEQARARFRDDSELVCYYDLVRAPAAWFLHYLIFPVDSKFLHSLKAFFAKFIRRDVAESFSELSRYQYVAFRRVIPIVAERINVAYFPLVYVDPADPSLQNRVTNLAHTASPDFCLPIFH